MATPLPPHLDPRGRHRGRARGQHGSARALRPIGRVLGAMLSIALLLFAGYLWLTFRNLNNGLHRLNVAVGVQPSGSSTTRDIDGKDQNLLLVGIDDRSNLTNKQIREYHVGHDTSLSTDTMMIVHIPADGSKATLISLPRDSWVAIPGYGMGKLNSAYADAYTHTSGTDDQKRTAGVDLLLKTITNLTGLTMDHYVQISFAGFATISNALGGVTVNMCANVKDQNSGVDLHKGKNTIKGASALAFVRQRYNFPNGLGDLDRVRRQQYFLTAAFRQLVSFNVVFKLNSVSSAIKQSIYTDNSLDLLSLAQQVELLSANNITGKTIPTAFGTADGQSILIVHPAKVRAFVDRVIGKTAPSTSSSTPSQHSASKSKSPSAIDAKCIY